MRYKLCILEDQRLLRKFCQAMDRHYNCKQYFGTSQDSFGQCKACPLATAEQAMYLMNLKGLPMGEAVKATLRGPVNDLERWEILRDVAIGGEPYIKPNEERAAAAVILGEARDEDDD